MNLDSLKRKLVLGTVQLGLPYGINNTTGKPDQSEAFRILEKAAREGIHLLDSAEAYGDSLHVIGSYIKQNKDAGFRVISKFIADGNKLTARVDKVVSELQLKSLYAYLFHRFSDYQTGQSRQELKELKREQKIQHIGVSIYSLEELKISMNDPEVSVIQIPLNPFDLSKEKKDLLMEARLSGKEIHVRSVFLQGLFFKEPSELTGNLKGFSGSLAEFQSILKFHQVDVRQACLNFALHQPFVDHVIVGVETALQLDQNIQAIIPAFSKQLLDSLESIPTIQGPLLNPSTWKP